MHLKPLPHDAVLGFTSAARGVWLCSSVCLSLCLSQAGVLSKGLNISYDANNAAW